MVSYPENIAFSVSLNIPVIIQTSNLGLNLTLKSQDGEIPEP